MGIIEVNVELRWTPHPVIVAIRDNKDCTEVLLYSFYHYYRVGDPPNVEHSRGGTMDGGILYYLGPP